MELNLINESLVFKVGNDHVESTVHFGDILCVVVDNFYENPKLVRDLAISIPPTSHTHRGAYPSIMINASYDLRPLTKTYQKYIHKYFPNLQTDDYITQNLDRATFMVNVMQSDGNEYLPPHIDNPSGFNLASTIYLNFPEECSGGTSFFDNDSNYLGHVEMKFNRMVIYLQNVKHTAYMERNSFVGSNYRFNQQIFM